MIEIGPFNPPDYDEVMALWRACEGLTLREADSRKAIVRYLERNPGLSFVGREEGQLAGAVLAAPMGAGAICSTSPSHRRTAAGASGGPWPNAWSTH